MVEKTENSDLYELKLKNFSLEFFNKFLRSNNVSFEKLEISGQSNFFINKNFFFQNIENFNFLINSEVVFQTNKGFQKLFLKIQNFLEIKQMIH